MGGNFGMGGDIAKMFEQARQRQAGGGGSSPSGGALNPYEPAGSNQYVRGDQFIDMGQLSQMREAMQRSMTPEMQQQIRDALAGAGGGAPGGMGMMAFGVGENERGKRVARGAKIMMDENGKVTKEFHEKQLDPDDLELPKAPTENYDDATEVQFEEDIAMVSSGGGKAAETITEVEIEVEEAPQGTSKK